MHRLAAEPDATLVGRAGGAMRRGTVNTPKSPSSIFFRALSIVRDGLDDAEIGSIRVANTRSYQLVDPGNENHTLTCTSSSRQISVAFLICTTIASHSRALGSKSRGRCWMAEWYALLMDPFSGVKDEGEPKLSVRCVR